MKRLLLAIILVLPAAGIANSVNAQDPLPRCLPCPPDPPPAAPSAVVVPGLPL